MAQKRSRVYCQGRSELCRNHLTRYTREPELQQANYTPSHRGILLGVCTIRYNGLRTEHQILLQALDMMIHKVIAAVRATGLGY
jgi:glycine cleavage system protein P-like pyridoxal-binding family